MVMASYNEFEKQIDAFMEDSGIRDFCRNYCKGRCCYGVRNTCGEVCKKGKMPATCSLFICEQLAGLLRLERYERLSGNIIFNQRLEDRWRVKRIEIGDDEEKLLKLIKRLNLDKIRLRIAYLKSFLKPFLKSD